MNFSLTLSVTEPFFAAKQSVIMELSEELKEYYIDRQFGESVQEILFGLIIVLDRPGYEEWHQPRRPRYINKDVKSRLTGEILQIRKHLSMEMRLSQDVIGDILAATVNDAKSILIKIISVHLKSIRKLPAGAHDFSIKDFISDLDKFALSRN